MYMYMFTEWIVHVQYMYMYALLKLQLNIYFTHFNIDNSFTRPRRVTDWSWNGDRWSVSVSLTLQIEDIHIMY